ncbi:MAG: MBL fold metallo-hydrolase [Syntrophales bacterium LBB04]|nr:MBL fold metallo-hydrolase [Syntrophales bacterium LBB04]
MANIQFLGAAGTVTGSKYLVDTGKTRFLVDCGMFQGAKQLRLQNWAAPPVAPDSIQDILLTHAHIDHIGMLPLYVKKGFGGSVYATPSTVDLCGLSLLDAAHLQEEDARFANKQGFSKHSPALPLYTTEDAQRSLELLRAQPYELELKLGGSATVRFRDAGHILGSAILDIRIDSGKNPIRVVFSGDLGRYNALILNDPSAMDTTDYLVVESTYGNRQHPPEKTYEEVAAIINQTAKRGGALVVPAFALGRTQTLLYVIRDLKARKLIPDLPVYVDSPMAIHASEIFNKYLGELDVEARQVYQATGHSPLLFPNLHYALTKDQSQQINSVLYPAVIISASGMATGGRILHHLKHRLPDPRNGVLFIGFQSSGTRGQILKDGGREIKIHGEMVPVRAQVHSMESFSGHADSTEILRWLRTFKKPPKRTFIVHGEPDSSAALADRIKKTLGWETHIPQQLETVKLV